LKKKNFVILTVAFVFLVIVASFLYKSLSSEFLPDSKVEITENTNAPDESKESEINDDKQLAPDFKVVNKDGETVSFSDYKGKPMIINFWASWCGFCVKEFPAFENVYNEYKNDINFMMINVTDGQQETFEGAKSFIEDKGYTFPVYYDTELIPSNIYGAYSIPITVLIDADGFYLGTHQGAMNEETLRAYAQELIYK